jgi:hypothetical protein
VHKWLPPTKIISQSKMHDKGWESPKAIILRLQPEANGDIVLLSSKLAIVLWLLISHYHFVENMCAMPFWQEPQGLNENNIFSGSFCIVSLAGLNNVACSTPQLMLHKWAHQSWWSSTLWFCLCAPIPATTCSMQPPCSIHIREIVDSGWCPNWRIFHS